MHYTSYFAAAVMLTIGLASCEDPEDLLEPRNPDLAVDAVVGTINSSARLLEGCERQLAVVYQELAPITEIASDNYVNTQTFFNQFLDNLTIDYTDDDLDDTQFAIQRLRALANLGLTTIGPGDENYNPDQNAEFLYFRGLAQLLAGSYFNVLPLESGGELQSRVALYEAAIVDFSSALDLATDEFLRNSLTLARSRAYYQGGNCGEAATDAQALLDAAPDFVRYVDFDAQEGPDNTLQNAIADRASFDDLQPLPRLDFLDPKYTTVVDPTTDFSIAYLKSEEAHFILAEAALASGDVDAAQEEMLDLLALISTRPVATFDDSSEGRTEDEPGSRPDTAIAVVASSPGADFIEDLVIDRGEGPVTIPSVSGTSVDSARVEELSEVVPALEVLYLMRQEVFIAEGRRFVDLGLTFVPSENELLLNENVTEADIEPVIPEFIASNSDQLDAFEYDPTTGEVVIAVDFNEVIVANRESDFVVPCF